jgi:SAM-dependent methyltransferase
MEEWSFKAGWMAIDETPEPEYYVRLMDRARGGREDEPGQYGAVFDLLEVEGGGRFLDVGCGTGGTARALAKRMGGAGAVVGVDNSETMIGEARRRSEGSRLPVEFHVADAHQLPLADASFDGAYSLRVFEIIGEPRRALSEMARVLRPGGRLVINAPDLDMWAFDSSDRAVTRKVLHHVCDYETNGWIGRQLPAMCRGLGLTDVKLIPAFNIVTEFELVYELALGYFVKRAEQAGAVSAEEVARWLDDLRQRDRRGEFLCTQMLFRIFARKP